MNGTNPLQPEEDSGNGKPLPLMGIKFNSNEELVQWARISLGEIRLSICFHVDLLMKDPKTEKRHRMRRELAGTRLLLKVRSPGALYQLLRGIRRFVENFKPNLSGA